MGLLMSVQEVVENINKSYYYPHADIRCGKFNCERSKGSSSSWIGVCTMVLIGDINFGSYVMIGRGVHLLTHYHKIHTRKILLLEEQSNPEGFTIPVSKNIGDDVWIYKSTILPQCSRIAKGVVIGIASVVTKDIDEEYSIWAGNPARKIGIRG